MLFLVFKIDQDRYAIDVRQIEEVLPVVSVKLIPQAHIAVSGSFNYHGQSVPLIDISLLALDRPSNVRLSTRIIVVNYPDASGKLHLLGVLAEYVTETISRSESDFQDTGVLVPNAPYLGKVATDKTGLVQWVEVPSLLSAQLRDLLFVLPTPQSIDQQVER